MNIMLSHRPTLGSYFRQATVDKIHREFSKNEHSQALTSEYLYTRHYYQQCKVALYKQRTDSFLKVISQCFCNEKREIAQGVIPFQKKGTITRRESFSQKFRDSNQREDFFGTQWKRSFKTSAGGKIARAACARRPSCKNQIETNLTFHNDNITASHTTCSNFVWKIRYLMRTFYWAERSWQFLEKAKACS